MSMDSVPESPKLSFIQRYHVILKAHYFLFFAGFGVVFPILNLTLRAHGLSNTEISLSNTILPFLIFVSSPLMGFIADKSRRFLLTFNILLFIVIGAFTILFSLSHIKSHKIQADLQRLKTSQYALDFCSSQEVVTQCSSRLECGCSYQAYCNADDLTFNFTMAQYSSIEHTLTDSLKSKCGIRYRVPIDKDVLQDKLNFQNASSIKCEITCSIAYFCHGLRYAKQTIYIFLHAILYIIGSNLLSSGSALGASIGFATLARSDLFGTQRVWGTIGFGILAYLTSLIYTFFESEYVYLVMFNTIATLTIIVTSFIPLHKNEKKSTEEEHPFDLKTLVLLLKNIEVAIFLSITFLWGMCFGCFHPYLALFIDEIDPCQSRTIIGRMFLIASISEVTAFYCARRVINFFGPNGSTIVIFLAFALRFSGYYFLPQPNYYLPMETMHFFNFGILYVLIAQKADLIAPPGMSSTLQGVAHGVIHGLGCGVGLLVSSYIYIVVNQRLLFLVFAILNLVAAILYSIYFLLTRKKTSSKNATVSATTNDVVEEDAHLNQESLPSLPMMEANNNENKKDIN
ncbi:unnamed protein product [Rotaria socialis]|uniref:Major facilitator superfamily associated domain-containing protein n=1 Tax=Rotaria socialis TaxID=392032 RepID=A0A819W467_9BILA|nr:unnamed protein product [Rotaria socialis]CAF3313894.1 unnamed protein product [Rotaria socialis]CAF3721350.1 unnamed protein product [Rotaria socialis]CAF4119942.1 unnamed protein product [Rotaria socialis]